jgi:hypothetical protein
VQRRVQVAKEIMEPNPAGCFWDRMYVLLCNKTTTTGNQPAEVSGTVLHKSIIISSSGIKEDYIYILIEYPLLVRVNECTKKARNP